MTPFSFKPVIFLVIAIASALFCSEGNVEEVVVSGQLLLPEGEGSRGVELIATVVSDNGEKQERWIRFDREGRFEQRFSERLVGLKVASGIGAVVYEFDSRALSTIDSRRQVKLRAVDLTEKLVARHVKLARGADLRSEVVRVSMWFQKPRKDVSLGSAQFPEVKPGTNQEWLLPLEFDAAYFLVEHPATDDRGRNWRSGKQQLFGPFKPKELPSELLID